MPGTSTSSHPAGGTTAPVTSSPAYDHQAAWAPGAGRLTFERDFDHSSSIFVVGADGSNLVRLTTGPAFDTGPAFSPRGTRIAFGTDRGGSTFPDLWLMRPDGANAHRLVDLPFANGFPDWQPLGG